MGRWIRNCGNISGGRRSEVIVKTETFVLWMISSFKLYIERLRTAETWSEPSQLLAELYSSSKY